MSSGKSVRVKTQELPVGSRLGHPINDDDDLLLLAPGALLTSAIKEHLQSRGINEVLLHPDDAAALRVKNKATAQRSSPWPSPRSPSTSPKISPRRSPPPAQSGSRRQPPPAAAELKLQVASLAASVSLQIKNTALPLSQKVTPKGCVPYDPLQRQRLEKNFSTTTKLLDDMIESALAGGLRDHRPLATTAENYVTELTDDVDHVIAFSREMAPDPQVTERSVRLALLAMATAIEMGWDEINVREIGLCGLVHDWGMFHLPPQLREPSRKLSADERAELAKHPLYTLDLLKPLEQVAPAIRYAATQVHESPDGSGYPRGLTKAKIHPFAHILHIVDAYISLTAKAQGRQAYLSYDVIVYLLHQVKLERMEQQFMRAFLNVVSLFPIGSHVRLSDGSEAQVIRRNAQLYSSPIVQRVGADRKLRLDSAHPSVINLAETDLRVMAPLLAPERQELRLEEKLMGKVLWEGGEG